MKLFNALKLERFICKYYKWFYAVLVIIGLFLLFGCGSSKKTTKTDIEETTELVTETEMSEEKNTLETSETESKDISIIVTDSEKVKTTIKADNLVIEPSGTIKAQGNVSVESNKKVAQVKENKDISVIQSNKKEETQLIDLSETTSEKTDKTESSKTTESKNETNIIQDIKNLAKWLVWLGLVVVIYIVYRDSKKRV